MYLTFLSPIMTRRTIRSTNWAKLIIGEAGGTLSRITGASYSRRIIVLTNDMASMSESALLEMIQDSTPPKISPNGARERRDNSIVDWPPYSSDPNVTENVLNGAINNTQRK
ncbi:hypothetical protein HI914_01215 [Erysiphe necator]|nr:hypothetical protein HI914_01215 [Erysiphe necator]